MKNHKHSHWKDLNHNKDYCVGNDNFKAFLYTDNEFNKNVSKGNYTKQVPNASPYDYNFSYRTPIVPIILHEEIEKQFNELAAKWKKETAGHSTMIHIAGNNNYLDIIGMGKDVVPFILKDLQKEPDFWFVALRHITKANPVPKEHLGKIERMTEDWLEWGRKNNLI